MQAVVHPDLKFMEIVAIVGQRASHMPCTISETLGCMQGYLNRDSL